MFPPYALCSFLSSSRGVELMTPGQRYHSIRCHECNVLPSTSPALRGLKMLCLRIHVHLIRRESSGFILRTEKFEGGSDNFTMVRKGLQRYYPGRSCKGLVNMCLEVQSVENVEKAMKGFVSARSRSIKLRFQLQNGSIQGVYNMFVYDCLCSTSTTYHTFHNVTRPSSM